MARRVTLENLPDAIADILDEYEDETIRTSHEVVKKVAQAGARAVNSQVGAAGIGGKRYRSSWTVQSQNSRLDASATIYSRIPGLPHLLEKGHALRGGGRTRGKPHIKPVEEKLVKEFENELKVGLQL